MTTPGCVARGIQSSDAHVSDSTLIQKRLYTATMVNVWSKRKNGKLDGATDKRVIVGRNTLMGSVRIMVISSKRRDAPSPLIKRVRPRQIIGRVENGN